MPGNLEEKTIVFPTLVPATRSVEVNGVDLLVGTEQRPLVVISAGTITGAGASFTFRVLHGIPGLLTNVPDVLLTNPQPAAVTVSDFFYETTYRGQQPILNVRITTVAGTSPTLDCAAYVITDGHRDLPA